LRYIVRLSKIPLTVSSRNHTPTSIVRCRPEVGQDLGLRRCLIGRGRARASSTPCQGRSRHRRGDKRREQVRALARMPVSTLHNTSPSPSASAPTSLLRLRRRVAWHRPLSVLPLQSRRPQVVASPPASGRVPGQLGWASSHNSPAQLR
jgi:hypothetical protein